MIELKTKETAAHSLVFGCYHELKLSGRIILYFDSKEELTALISLIIDCATVSRQQSYSDASQTLPSCRQRLEQAEYRQLVDTVIGKNSLYSEYDCGEYFSKDFFRDSDEIVNRVISDLVSVGFSNHNQINKYYAYAFAVDFVRFEHYSKMCYKQLVDWGTGTLKDKKGKKDEAEDDKKPTVSVDIENSVLPLKQQIIVAVLDDDGGGDYKERLLYREDYRDDSTSYGHYLPFLS